MVSGTWGIPGIVFAETGVFVSGRTAGVAVIYNRQVSAFVIVVPAQEFVSNVESAPLTAGAKRKLLRQ
jgi:hypothetical protein